jgi:hypothetical protein
MDGEAGLGLLVMYLSPLKASAWELFMLIVSDSRQT